MKPFNWTGRGAQLALPFLFSEDSEVVQGTSVQSTDGHRDVGLAFHIDEGDFNGVSLGGLHFLAATVYSVAILFIS